MVKTCEPKSWFTTAYLVLLAAFTAGLLMVPSSAQAIDRLTDSEVKQLIASLETSRAAFEAALDPKLKDRVLRGSKTDADIEEFLDDLQSQVARTTERFNEHYSASSEVSILLQYTTRLDKWAKTQPAGFKGSTEWDAFASNVRRLSAAYNTTMPIAADGVARRFNDAELVVSAANVEKLCDPFRSEVEASLTANKSVSAADRENTLKQVDMLKSNAHALNQKLANNEKGIAEAEALIKQALVVVQVVTKYKMSSAATAAWTPLRAALGEVSWAYEVNNKSLPIK